MCSRLPGGHLSAPFADGVEGRCFPLKKIGPTENVCPGQAARISVVCRPHSLEAEHPSGGCVDVSVTNYIHFQFPPSLPSPS